MRENELILYHDFASPYCRLAFEVGRRVAAHAGLQLRLEPFELRPAPEPLPDVGDPAIQEELASALPLAAEWRIDLHPPPLLPRTRKAHEAVLLARADGREVALAAALYQALWVEGRDIGRLDALAAAATAAGLDAPAMHVSLGLDAAREETRRALEAAESAGITGVPTFVLGDRAIVGLVAPDRLGAWVAGE